MNAPNHSDLYQGLWGFLSEAYRHFHNWGDFVASFSAFLVIVSHWSEVLTPIVALIVGVLTAIWWCIRLWDRLVNGVGEK